LPGKIDPPDFKPDRHRWGQLYLDHWINRSITW